MTMFKHDAKQFKFDVLREVATRAFNNDLEGDIPNEIAHLLINSSADRFRCCQYKERAIIRRRTRLALGQFPNQSPCESQNKKQIIRVVEPACDGCTIQRIRITDNCRKCMAKACMSACNFGAISMGPNKAVLDPEKCRECGACANECPYNAIVKTERPCAQHCPVDAITWDEHGIALIDEAKCINCGQCQASCPFGAIEDLCWMRPVIDELREGHKMIAVFAPAIQGQLDSATIPQIKKSLELLGFDKTFEAAISADAVAVGEHKELLENMEKGIKMTTSCCPAFVNLARIHFPEVYEKNVSTMVSPMVAMGRLLKKEYPDHKVVFIGPCVAKKQEAQSENSGIDYVLTFEELAAMLVAKHIYPSGVEADECEFPSMFGRAFAQGGGVAAAVLEVHKEEGYDTPVKTLYSDGCKECKKNLLLMKLGRLDCDILEGMSCVGGCINGPVIIHAPKVTKPKITKENLTTDQKTIQESMSVFDFSGVDLHRHH